MKRYITFAIIMLIASSQNARADFTIDVLPSPAPNIFSSPSWDGWTANALFSIENGLGNIGDRNTDPTAYEVFESGAAIPANEIIVSSFASWRGQANPASPFDNENGNRVHFGVHIVGDGTEQFRLADVFLSISSSDGGVLDFTRDFATANYVDLRFGIDYGADRVKGGGDDVVINSGAGTQLVDELVYVGDGNAYDASNSAGATDQEKLDTRLSEVLDSPTFDIVGSYTLSDSGGTVIATGSSSFSVVPEPGAAMALAIIAACGAMRRRRSS